MVRTDHSNSDIAYLSYSGFNGFGGDTVGHIFKTTDGGTTWTDISGTAAGALPNTPVNDIAVVHLGSPLNFDALFIGTDVGVFRVRESYRRDTVPNLDTCRQRPSESSRRRTCVSRELCDLTRDHPRPRRLGHRNSRHKSGGTFAAHFHHAFQQSFGRRLHSP